MLRILNLLVAMVLLTNTAYSQNFSNVQITETKVTDNIYYLKGSGGNIGLYTWAEGNLIVDSQFKPLGDKIKTKIASLANTQTKYLLNTHYHGDHLGGNSNFSADGVTIIAQDNVRERVQIAFTNTVLKREVKPRPKEDWPVMTFSESMSLFLGDEEVKAIFIPEAHTDGDAIIYFKNANVIHAGDVFVRYGYPFVDISSGGTIDGIIAGLDKIMEVADADTKIIPGHGELANEDDVKLLRDVLADCRFIVKKLKEQGKSLDDILTLKPLAKYDDQYSGSFINGNTFIQLIYESL
ncbi:MAG: MBL fold metallo-hydrolase [Bacteroidota bacterium]